ncbi:hypothetical protein SAMN05216352_102206 [Alteribacillus bidgolensis]|uniref:Uncharacterized protein n=1 Tax=Alteribacillus bidgolensis TaxID=930129 RepID=A0A1G8EFN0_9BACI|nr:hypothetical protein SAMN05216352_102206 [Alteribacillus bidgolensis]
MSRAAFFRTKWPLLGFIRSLTGKKCEDLTLYGKTAAVKKGITTYET